MLTPDGPARRAHLRLGRVLDDLGRTFLDIVHCPPEPPGEVGGVVIHDPVEEPALLPEGALVLAVGVVDADDVVRLLDAYGSRGVTGLVVRAPAPFDERVRVAVERSGVALLALTRGASWAQVAAMLRALLAEGDVGDSAPQTLGGIPSGDLFALANAVAALIDAPVTIEDRGSRVIAFSGRQDEADPSRIATVLGRQVPERFSRLLAEQGVFHRLYRADRPVYVEPVPETLHEFSLTRVAVAVRAGDEVLGSIWAAVRERLSAERTQALRDAAAVAALHLLRIRAGADVGRRLRADLVGTALEGGPGAQEALGRLGLSGAPVVVLALALREDAAPDGEDPRRTSRTERLVDGLAMHLSAVHPRCATAQLGDVAYALLPVGREEDGERRAVATASHFLERVGERVDAAIGVSAVAHDLAGLVAARGAADRALRVLRSSGAGGRHVARAADVHVESLVLELRDLVEARGDPPGRPIARLTAYDDRHGTDLVPTLAAWLDNFGDVIAASAEVHVHPNTFRYRLRRIAEIGGLDLTDRDARFGAMLALRITRR